MTRISLRSAVCVCALLGCPTAFAQVYMYDFSATTVQGVGSYAAATFGSSVTGTFTVDYDALNQVDGSSTGAIGTVGFLGQVSGGPAVATPNPSSLIFFGSVDPPVGSIYSTSDPATTTVSTSVVQVGSNFVLGREMSGNANINQFQILFDTSTTQSAINANGSLNIPVAVANAAGFICEPTCKNSLSFQLTSLTQVSAVPEPSTNLLMAIGLALGGAGILFRRCADRRPNGAAA